MLILVIVIVILLSGAIAAYIVIRPSLSDAGQGKEMIIPLSDIASLWTQHNHEVIPLSMEEIDQNSQADIVDTLWNSKMEVPADVQTQAFITTPTQNTTNPEGPTPTTSESPVADVTVAPETDPLPRMAEAQGITEAQGLSLLALEKSLRSVWNDCIAPYKEIIKSQGAEEIIMSLLRLLEKHGHCPSVVMDKRDDESLDLISVRDNLAQVTLRDHTYAVCRNMLSIVKKNIMDSENMIPGALVMALAHDIGKIPEFRISGAYNAKDHAHVGANKLMEIMQGRTEFWVKKAISAVREHHSPTKDDQTSMLKEADRQARQTELAAHTQSYEIKPFEKWFSVKNFITKYIAPMVNVDKTGKWNAFSFKGTIYARPDWIYEQARRMCHDEKILDMKFVYSSEKDNVIRIVVSAMRKENLTPLLGDNYYARKFDVKTSIGVQKLSAFFLTAFTIPDYINVSELESRKSGFSEIIDTVRPLS